MGSMTFSRSLLSRRRQVKILSVSANKKEGELTEPAAARPAVAPHQLTFLELRAESNCRASLDGRLPSDTLEAIPQKNSRGDCCKSRRRFASARASKALL